MASRCCSECKHAITNTSEIGEQVGKSLYCTACTSTSDSDSDIQVLRVVRRAPPQSGRVIPLDQLHKNQCVFCPTPSCTKRVPCKHCASIRDAFRLDCAERKLCMECAFAGRERCPNCYRVISVAEEKKGNICERCYRVNTEEEEPHERWYRLSGDVLDTCALDWEEDGEVENVVVLRDVGALTEGMTLHSVQLHHGWQSAYFHRTEGSEPDFVADMEVRVRNVRPYKRPKLSSDPK